jgi:hypothetical protein
VLIKIDTFQFFRRVSIEYNYTMISQFASLLTSSHLDIKVPLNPIPSPPTVSQILAENSRRTLFFGNRWFVRC